MTKPLARSLTCAATCECECVCVCVVARRSPARTRQEQRKQQTSVWLTVTHLPDLLIKRAKRERERGQLKEDVCKGGTGNGLLQGLFSHNNHSHTYHINKRECVPRTRQKLSLSLSLSLCKLPIVFVVLGAKSIRRLKFIEPVLKTRSLKSKPVP